MEDGGHLIRHGFAVTPSPPGEGNAADERQRTKGEGQGADSSTPLRFAQNDGRVHGAAQRGVEDAAPYDAGLVPSAFFLWKSGKKPKKVLAIRKGIMYNISARVKKRP